MLSGTFQGAAAAAETRPPLNLDFPLWTKAQPPHATLEDMELTCQKPTTVSMLRALLSWLLIIIRLFLIAPLLFL